MISTSRSADAHPAGLSGCGKAAFVAWCSLAVALASFAAQAGDSHSSATRSQVPKGQAASVLTPSPGSPQRKAVLDALRKELKRLHAIDAIFVVQHIHVKGRWAWVEAQPQSTDGSARFESIAALLRQDKTGWRVVDIPCAEPDDHQCLGGPKFSGAMLGRFPAMPPEILSPAAAGADAGLR